jgi:hypothetical protein
MPTILYLEVVEILEEAMQIARLLQLLVPLLEHGSEQLPDLAQLVGPLPDHHRLLGVRDRDLLRLLVKRLKLRLKIYGLLLQSTAEYASVSDPDSIRSVDLDPGGPK